MGSQSIIQPNFPGIYTKQRKFGREEGARSKICVCMSTTEFGLSDQRDMYFRR